MTFETINEDRHDRCDDNDCPVCLDDTYWSRLDEMIDPDFDYVPQQYRMC